MPLAVFERSSREAGAGPTLSAGRIGGSGTASPGLRARLWKSDDLSFGPSGRGSVS